MKNDFSEVTTFILRKDHIHKMHISKLQVRLHFQPFIIGLHGKVKLHCFVTDIPISRKQNYEMVLRVKIFH